MTRLTAATIVLGMFVAASFGADMWLDESDVKAWGWWAGFMAIVWIICLVAHRDRAVSSSPDSPTADLAADSPTSG